MFPRKSYILIFFLVCLFFLSKEVYSQAIPNFGTDKPKKAATKDSKDSKDEVFPGIDEFVPVDQQPTIVKRAPTTYPELARTARVEGTVYLKVLVDKEGKPRQVHVFKSDAEVFNEAAKESAMKSTYSPAISDGNPVACWVIVPYQFKLK